MDSAKQQRCDAFSSRAEHYALEREQLPYFQAQLNIVLSMLAGEHGTVLDIGCAAGGEIPSLQRAGFSVVGIDFSPAMLDFAGRRFSGNPGVQFCRADVERLPFASKSVDHVVCLGVLEYVSNYAIALKEINRVLRPGGLAILAIPSRLSLYNISNKLIENSLGLSLRTAKRVVKGQSGSLTRKHFQRNLCVPWKLRSLLRFCGLQPEHSRYSNFFIYPLDRFPKLHVSVAAALEPLTSVPLVRNAASVYLVSARKK